VDVGQDRQRGQPGILPAAPPVCAPSYPPSQLRPSAWRAAIASSGLPSTPVVRGVRHIPDDGWGAGNISLPIPWPNRVLLG
jgi:hypothetical protein